MNFGYDVIRRIAPDWYADRYSANHRASLQAVDPYAVISKIGVHCVGPRRTGYGAFLQTIKAAGRRLSVVKCRDDFGAAYEAKQYWPDVLTVGAFTQFDGLNFDYAKFVSLAKRNPWIDYWEVLNEINGQWVDQANLYISLMPRFRADGLRLAMFSCASGTPPLPSEDGGAAYSEIARACKEATFHRYDAILCLHEYVSVGTIGRYVALRDYLVARGAMLPLVISEWGYETHPGDTQLLDTVRRYDTLYMSDEWVEGCATWTLGGGGWGASNYERALTQLAQHIATVAPVTPPPVDETFTASVTMPTKYRAELTAYVTERGGTVSE